MTKTFKNLLVLVVAFTLMLTLTGCGFASKAQKLDEQFKAGEELTLEAITDKMGDATMDLTIDAFGLRSGAVVWVSGCKTAEEFQAKLEAEEEGLEALVVTLVANKITSVDYVPEYKGEK